MKNNFFIALLLGVLALSSCEKEGFGPLSDSPAAIPVTVSNVFDYRPRPTVQASKAANLIKIDLEIPATSGRTIKEITRVAAAAGGNFAPIRDSATVKSTGLYSLTPIAGNGTKVSFSTTFTDYKAKVAATADPASNALLARDFYFRLTLDNGDIIYPESVRVWVVD
ncbi:hypothetical protein V9K67_24825 [Paraflavisolibacter sp. H34]|uniref:hypothetical protein n=1 Tax=Huijunlia imazamoxiresistens TaxID=3127457 RepID=UPI003016B89C